MLLDIEFESTLVVIFVFAPTVSPILVSIILYGNDVCLSVCNTTFLHIGTILRLRHCTALALVRLLIHSGASENIWRLLGAVQYRIAAPCRL